MQLHGFRRLIVPVVLGISLAAMAGCGGAEARRAKHMQKGHDFLAAGNFDKARVEFQNALQITPNDAEARFENGVVDEKLGNMREAAQFYQGALDVNPEHLAARASLAKLYLFSGAADKAMELIKPAMDKHPDDARLLTVRAAARAQLKDMSGAEEDAARAVQLAPKDEDAVAVLSGLYTSAGEKDKARALLESAVKNIPQTVDLRLVLAQLYAGENRTAESESLLLDLVRLKPNDRSHRIRLAQFYARMNRPDEAEKVLREGIAALPKERDLKTSLVDFLAARRSPEAAEKELQSMIAADPGDDELRFALARFYEERKDLAKAQAVYQGVIDTEKLNPGGLTARTRLAALLAQRNDVSGAEKLANEVLNKSPRDNDALILRGNIALSRQDPKSAIADLRAVLRDQPNALGVLRSLARAHLANGEPAIAEETMRRAVDANPKDPSVRLDFAQLLAQLGKPEQAKPMLGDLVKQQPDNIPALDAQFRVAWATKDVGLAESAAAAIVASRPKAPAGYLYQGMIAEAQKKVDAALRLYATAADLQPEAPEALQAQIRLLVNQKRVAEALKRLDEVDAAHPNVALAANIKGELLLATGRAAEAQQAFQAAIKRTPQWWAPYRGLAHAQVAAKDTEAALATLRKGVSATDQPEALGAESASLLEQMGRTDEAMREYEDLLKRNPRLEVAANNLAMLLASHRKDTSSLDRAKELASRFAQSNNPAFLDTYGWVLYKRGETAASIPVLEKVVQVAPDSPVARYHLGMAQSVSGSKTDARENLSRAVNSGARFTGIEEARATLETLARLPPSATAPRS